MIRICREEFEMETIKIPYYTSSMDLHVDEANLKKVIYAGTDSYQAKMGEMNSFWTRSNIRSERRACGNLPGERIRSR